MTDSSVGAISLSDDERRLIALWAADCAARVLSLFEAKAPEDTRPREAIEETRLFGLGGRRTGRLRSLSWAAHAAAREVGDPVASAAARAAAHAAASAYIHALASPHQARHIHEPAVCLALAREFAADHDPAVGDEEIRWAVEHAPRGICAVIRRMPVTGGPGRTRLSTLRHQLDAGLRR